jgi:hypothetical protein
MKKLLVIISLLFEQRRRDINKTQAIQVLALSKALGCSMFDLLEV